MQKLYFKSWLYHYKLWVKSLNLYQPMVLPMVVPFSHWFCISWSTHRWLSQMRKIWEKSAINNVLSRKKSTLHSTDFPMLEYFWIFGLLFGWLAECQRVLETQLFGNQSFMFDLKNKNAWKLFRFSNYKNNIAFE